MEGPCTSVPALGLSSSEDLGTFKTARGPNLSLVIIHVATAHVKQPKSSKYHWAQREMGDVYKESCLGQVSYLWHLLQGKFHSPLL